MRYSGPRTLMALAVAGLAAAGCEDAPTPTEPRTAAVENAAPLLAAAPGQGIADRYIVVFHDRTEDAPGLAQRLVAAHGGTLHFTYRSALRGFAATLPAPAVEAIRRNPNVAYVEQDAVVTVSTTQSNPPWGLDRIDQRDLPLNSTFNYTATGAGVNIYVIDTGIRFDHSDFAVPGGTSRAQPGFDALGGTGQDCHSHGTHVAGTAGGNTSGVAKGATLVSVRVFDCFGNGSSSATIAGVDWVTDHRVLPAVANMSLSSSGSTATDDAVARSVARGVTYVVAAGNQGTDACTRSPARAAVALTVAASTSSDARWADSNSGSCVDLFAPGAGVVSASHTGPFDFVSKSGTSMAAPHAAGVAAVYLEGNRAATPATVMSALASAAYTDKLGDVGAGSPNRLLSSLVPSTPPPALSASVSCTLWSGSQYSCTAQASGGSRLRYAFTWSGYASEYYDQGGTSRAYVTCQRPTGSYQGTLSAYGTVTDSNGIPVSFSFTRSC